MAIDVQHTTTLAADMLTEQVIVRDCLLMATQNTR